jgi:hypothetical protein
MNQVTLLKRCFVVCALLLSGCSSADVKVVETVEAEEVIEIPAAEELGVIKIGKIYSDIEDGEYVGSYDIGPTCRVDSISDIDIHWDNDEGAFSDSFLTKTAYKAFNDIDNLKIIGDPNKLFMEEEDEDPDYLISAQITDVELGICKEFSLLFGYYSGKESGRAYVKTIWQVYSVADNKIVYNTETEGYYELDTPNKKGIKKVIRGAFKKSIKNLLAEENFFKAIKNPYLYESGNKAEAKKSNKYQKAIYVPKKNLFKDPITQNIPYIKNSVVRINVGTSLGSGFFVSPEYILTNRHVVGGNENVIITLEGGIKINGKVLRKDYRRDVALIKTDKIVGAGLPIRTTDVIETDEVYAIGSPLEDTYQGTVTKGVVSNFVKNRFYKDLIQADVDIQEGNSGGALVDKNGNIVGITVSGIGKRSIGMNFFIPIKDALNHLNVKLQ